MAKGENNQVIGIFAFLLGLAIIFYGSNLFRSDKAFILIKGELLEDAKQVKTTGRRSRVYYQFKFKNHGYRKLTFTNSELKEMKSGIDYERLLKKNTKVKMHVLKKDFHKELLTIVYSLEVEGKKIVELKERTTSDWKGFALGIFMLFGGFLLFFD